MKMREELFRHLNYVENTELIVAQNVPSFIVNALAALGTFLAATVALLSIMLARDSLDLPNPQALDRLVIYVVASSYSVFMIRFYKRVKPLPDRTGITMNVIRNLRHSHIDASKNYLEKLKSRCKSLYEQGCAGNIEIICPDLIELEQIEKNLNLESSSRCVS